MVAHVDEELGIVTLVASLDAKASLPTNVVNGVWRHVSRGHQQA